MQISPQIYRARNISAMSHDFFQPAGQLFLTTFLDAHMQIAKQTVCNDKVASKVIANGNISIIVKYSTREGSVFMTWERLKILGG